MATDLVSILLVEATELRNKISDLTYEKDRLEDMLTSLCHETRIFLDARADGNNYGFDFHGLHELIASFEMSYQDIREANLDVFSL